MAATIKTVRLSTQALITRAVQHAGARSLATASSSRESPSGGLPGPRRVLPRSWVRILDVPTAENSREQSQRARGCWCLTRCRRPGARRCGWLCPICAQVPARFLPAGCRPAEFDPDTPAVWGARRGDACRLHLICTQE